MLDSLIPEADATPSGTALETLAAAPTALTCASCHGINSLDSRFCRHCGTTLPTRSATNGAANGAAEPDGVRDATSAAAHGMAEMPGLSLDAAEADEAEEVEAASGEIDRRRAQGLLERAFRLTEKGQTPEAILACRQAVALDPHSASGFSMLGLLLERSGDVTHAIDAYEHVLRLTPDAVLERESLQRLKDNSNGPMARQFHFNPSELFNDAPATVADTVPVAEAPTPVAELPAPPAAEMPSASDAPAPPQVVAPAAVAAVTTAAPVLAAPVAAASIAVQPLIAPPASGAAPPIRFAPPLSPVPLTGLSGAPLSTPVSFVDEAAAAPRGLNALVRNPPFYFRGAPILATVGTGLLFMIWASDWSIARAPRSAPATVIQVQTPVVPNPGEEPVPALRAPDGGSSPDAFDPNESRAGVNSGAPIPAPPASQASGGGANPAVQPAQRSTTVTRTTNRTTGRSATQASNPNRAGGAVPPAALPPARVTPSLPAPAASSNDVSSGVSTGGGPFNPDAVSRRTTVRIGGRPPTSAPNRSSTRARQAEQAASRAASSGQRDVAVQRLTRAIEAGGEDELGWRYQQRALAFLESGDNARALDDFQAAISAYQNQIRRGERVAEARAAIDACRGGVQLARANSGR